MKGNSQTPAPDEEAGEAASGEAQPDLDPSGTVQKEAPELYVVGAPTTDLGELPAVARYLSRIGAQIVNFKSARVIRTQNGYPLPVGWVRFGDGSIETGGEADPPTPGEREAILAELGAANLPKHTPVVAIGDPPPGVSLSDPNVFVCHDFDGRISMVHQRYENSDGTKGFIPWTRWSDGKWRRMEPETLPFFGLPGAKDCSTLFLHEGPKGAARLKKIIAGEIEARFPWIDSMKWGQHVGWIGGVHAVDRSDWAKLAAMGWKQVVIVADNDAPGWRVVSEIAKRFRCPTKVLCFGSDFPLAFDLGDEWPDSLFDETGHYVGQPYSECCQPADYATDLIQIQTDSGRLKTVPVARPNFVEQNFIVIDTQQVFNVDRPSRARSKDQFNDDTRWRSDAKDTYAELLKHGEAICARRVYYPALPPGPVIDNGERCWNAYQQPSVKPVKGDAAPFLDFMAHLIPVEQDRLATLRWLATLVARPDVRMRYSVLLISKKQGVGKSTVGVILKRLLGASNVSFPSENAIAESAFNGWALGKRLIVVGEIYTNGRSTVYDKLKPYVTDDDIEINQKFVQAFNIVNCAVILACSNSEKALFIPDDDRRWLIPTVTESLKDRQWWDALHSWLDADGVGIILNWARHFVKTDWVRTGERAPETAAKRAIISASKSEGRLLARDFGEEFAIMDPTVVRIGDVRSWIAAKRGIDPTHPHLEKERLIIDELGGIPGLHIWKGDQRPRIGGKRGAKAAVVFNFEPEAGQPWSALEGHLRMMEQIGFSHEY